MQPVDHVVNREITTLTGGPRDRQHLFPNEELDILVLNKFVAPHYQPSASPTLMVVGYSSLREAEILRGFHEDSYGFAHRAPTVVGCNIALRHAAGSTDSIDKLYMGHFEGDAKDIFTWHKPFLDFGGSSRFCYDMAYIRNPDLLDIRDWGAVFARAVEMTAPTGVVVSLIRKEDTDRFERLASHLKNEYGIEPLTATETNINLEDDPLRQHFLIAIFKGQAG